MSTAPSASGVAGAAVVPDLASLVAGFGADIPDLPSLPAAAFSAVTAQTSLQTQTGGAGEQQSAVQTATTVQTAVGDLLAEVDQGIWQLQIGCLFSCRGTVQVQQATQASTTAVMASGAAGVPAAATVTRVAVVWQLQIGCLFWCYGTLQIQTATIGAATVQTVSPVAPSPAGTGAPGGASPAPSASQAAAVAVAVAALSAAAAGPGMIGSGPPPAPISSPAVTHIASSAAAPVIDGGRWTPARSRVDNVQRLWRRARLWTLTYRGYGNVQTLVVPARRWTLTYRGYGKVHTLPVPPRRWTLTTTGPISASVARLTRSVSPVRTAAVSPAPGYGVLVLLSVAVLLAGVVGFGLWRRGRV